MRAAVLFNAAARGLIVATHWRLWPTENTSRLKQVFEAVTALILELRLGAWIAADWDEDYVPPHLAVLGQPVWIRPPILHLPRTSVHDAPVPLQRVNELYASPPRPSLPPTPPARRRRET